MSERDSSGRRSSQPAMERSGGDTRRAPSRTPSVGVGRAMVRLTDAGGSTPPIVRRLILDPTATARLSDLPVPPMDGQVAEKIAKVRRYVLENALHYRAARCREEREMPF